MAPLDPTTRLSIAELAIYIILVPLIVYILLRHGKSGYFGWGFMIAFCGLRLAADGIQIGNHDEAARGELVDNAGAIVNAIGISGLLYGLSGLIHEWSELLASLSSTTLVSNDIATATAAFPATTAGNLSSSKWLSTF
jgi:hypothetical protein